jgi:two-component system, OmpR family, response regulator CpxR
MHQTKRELAKEDSMPVITMFSGSFCEADQVADNLINRTHYDLITDQTLLSTVAVRAGMKAEKLAQAFSAKDSIFNQFTHEKERSVSFLKLAAAEAIARQDLLIQGFSSLLVPAKVTHALRVCLIADVKFRSSRAAEQLGMTIKEALKTIHKNDEDCAAWVHHLFNRKDPWAAEFYDIVIPMNQKSPAEAADLVMQHLTKTVLRPTEASKAAVRHFHLAARVEVALAQEGHNVDVAAEGDGKILLTINKHVLMLNRLEEDLKAVAGRVPGVQEVRTTVGKGFHEANIYRKYDFKTPSKVLLVDDEREFVQTLSERLQVRDVGSAVAYDGESALHMVAEDEPEVMILDLKMPGIDGIEVLRRVKKTHPKIEVIILTGHGNEEDRKVCMELGAFAYLQKPVNINELSEVLQKANEKAHSPKSGNQS